MSCSRAIDEIINRHTAFFRSGQTLTQTYRAEQIKNIVTMMKENTDDLISALRQDYFKTSNELQTEVNYCISQGNYALSNMSKWMAERPIASDFLNMHNSMAVLPEPYGNVLVMAPWNFPIILAIEPVIGAISAGNTVTLMTSALVPTLGAKIKELFTKYLNNEGVTVVTDPAMPEHLVKAPFDMIFFTGSTEIGRKVMAAASENLTPVVLELGGKCPCYVHSDSDILRAGKRIAHCSMVNAGQMCVSVDYVLCHKDVVNKLIDEIVAQWKCFFGDDLKSSPDFGRIVNQHHTKRLASLIESASISDQKIHGGSVDLDDRYVEPTLFLIKERSSVLLQNEIFGPVLGILPVENEDEAIEIVGSKAKPLHIYLFTQDQSVMEKFKLRTSSGGLIINEAYFQMTARELPFGGVGQSGMGRYHGISTFNCFSNPKSIFRNKYSMPLIDRVVFPPFTDSKQKWYNYAVRGEFMSGCNII